MLSVATLLVACGSSAPARHDAGPDATETGTPDASSPDASVTCAPEWPVGHEQELVIDRAFIIPTPTRDQWHLVDLQMVDARRVAMMRRGGRVTIVDADSGEISERPLEFNQLAVALRGEGGVIGTLDGQHLVLSACAWTGSAWTCGSPFGRFRYNRVGVQPAPEGGLVIDWFEDGIRRRTVLGASGTVGQVIEVGPVDVSTDWAVMATSGDHLATCAITHEDQACADLTLGTGTDAQFPVVRGTVSPPVSASGCRLAANQAGLLAIGSWTCWEDASRCGAYEEVVGEGSLVVTQGWNGAPRVRRFPAGMHYGKVDDRGVAWLIANGQSPRIYFLPIARGEMQVGTIHVSDGWPANFLMRDGVLDATGMWIDVLLLGDRDPVEALIHVTPR
jgi:hypothetical protein